MKARPREGAGLRHEGGPWSRRRRLVANDPKEGDERATCGHHGRGRTRLSRLQRGLPRRRRGSGGGLHGRPDTPVSTTAGTPPRWPGPRYPDGIPIWPEARLEELIARRTRRTRSSSRTATYPTSSSCTRRRVRSPRVRISRCWVPNRTMVPAVGAGDLGLRRPHGSGQEPDVALPGRAVAGTGPAAGDHPPSHALRRPRASAGPAVRDPGRPGSIRDHRRGAGGLRTAPAPGPDRVRRRRLPGRGGGGRARGRPDRLGRRQQRLLVRTARPRDRGGRPVPTGARDQLPPRGSQSAAGGRGRGQQGGLCAGRERRRCWWLRCGPSTRGRPSSRSGRPSAPRAAARRSAASGSWSSRTVPR